ncbi:zinc finger protein 888-like [Leptopilina boulardi]|uniref:zinc finger protein 888-like n=1 Tax=Leptopilina boulardi TaxID=63433 RepID=UPI0021F508C5|nr:zinc finger protein 888-like [Leptopilina boulardi]
MYYGNLWQIIPSSANNSKKRRGRPSEGPYICMKCGKLFNLKVLFKEHQRKECKNVLSSSNGKKKNNAKSRKLKKTSEKIYKIIQKPQINVEEIILPASPSNVINSGEKKFSCPTCNRSYVNYRDLVRHQRYICEKEPQFACTYCDRRFYHRYRLHHHLISLHPGHLS